MKKLLLLLIIPFLSFGQCIDGDFDDDGICDEIDDCVGIWVPNITTGNCSKFTSLGSGVCNSYSGCEWTSYWNSITYSNSNNCVGSYEIDNGYCEALVLNITELLERKSLIKTIDILGRETTNKGFQLHIYDDGSVEKKYLIK